jgi:hypothetical protein
VTKYSVSRIRRGGRVAARHISLLLEAGREAVTA